MEDEQTESRTIKIEIKIEPGLSEDIEIKQEPNEEEIDIEDSNYEQNDYAGTYLAPYCKVKYELDPLSHKVAKSENTEFVTTHIKQECDDRNQSEPNLVCSDQESTVKSEERENKFICDICKKQFNEKRYLRSHMSIHYGGIKYSCELCENNFSSKRGMVHHQNTVHFKKNSAECSICKKTFNCKYLSSHINTVHKGAKPYSCKICHKLFSQLSTLKKHKYTHMPEKSFSCRICDKKFSHKNSVIVHERIHRQEKPYSCKICGKNFIQKIHLKVHERYHSAEKSFVCEICDKRFYNEHVLTVHKSVHTKEQPFTCKFCNKRYTQTSSLNVHLKRHHSKEISQNEHIQKMVEEAAQKALKKENTKETEIDKCNKTIEKTFTKIKPFNITIEHDDNIKADFSRSKCNETDGELNHSNLSNSVSETMKSEDSSSLKDNIVQNRKVEIIIEKKSMIKHKREQKPFTDESKTASQSSLSSGKQDQGEPSIYTCEICNKQFTKRLSLIAHKRVHSVGYSCKICYKHLPLKSSVASHKIHGDAFIFACNTCKRCFNSKSSLTHECLYRDGFTCNICKKLFASKSNLRVHERSHSGEKAFACNICPKQYTQKSSLTAHLRTHSADKPFVCYVCNQQFTQIQSLDSHFKNNHSDEKGFECDVCHKRFSQMASLNAHKRIHKS